MVIGIISQLLGLYSHVFTHFFTSAALPSRNSNHRARSQSFDANIRDNADSNENYCLWYPWCFTTFLHSIVLDLYLSIFIYTYIRLHYITLHSITLHYITFHSITLHYITSHYIALHYTTLHYITLHYIIFIYIYIIKYTFRINHYNSTVIKHGPKAKPLRSSAHV